MTAPGTQLDATRGQFSNKGRPQSNLELTREGKVGFHPRVPFLKILVVEDHEPVRRLICLSLQQKPEFQVIQASDGLEAIQKAKELQPDLVLMDIGLPKLNGIEAAKRIRRIAPHVKLLFVSQ